MHVHDEATPTRAIASSAVQPSFSITSTILTRHTAWALPTTPVHSVQVANKAFKALRTACFVDDDCAINSPDGEGTTDNSKVKYPLRVLKPQKWSYMLSFMSCTHIPHALYSYMYPSETESAPPASMQSPTRVPWADLLSSSLKCPRHVLRSTFAPVRKPHSRPSSGKCMRVRSCLPIMSSSSVALKAGGTRPEFQPPSRCHVISSMLMMRSPSCVCVCLCVSLPELQVSNADVKHKNSRFAQ